MTVVLGIMGAFAYFIFQTAPESPAAPRSYPYNGLEKELGGRNLAIPEEEIVDDE